MVAGTSFLVCDEAGDIHPGGLNGYYALDTRLLHKSQLLVDGEVPRLIASSQASPSRLRSLAILGDPTTARALVVRDLEIGDFLTHRITVWNLTHEPASGRAELSFASDFADVFEVKRGEVPRRGFVGTGPSGGGLVLSYRNGAWQRDVRIAADRPAEYLRDSIAFDLSIPPRQRWEVTVRAVPGAITMPPNTGATKPRKAALGGLHRDSWPEGLPELQSLNLAVAQAWQRSVEDLGALRLWDDAQPDVPVLAAGVPWFMALFGRDSLIAGMQALPVTPRLLVGSLLSLAARQGRVVDHRTGEEPGKILHEVRAGAAVQAPEGWGEVYYGSVDATPLFVMGVTAAWRWGVDPDVIRRLLPAAEAAVDWVLGPGDVDGDGFVEYQVAHPAHGLTNQGWKDSYDGIRYADGRIPRGPIALVEVQGYACAALFGLADMREWFGTADPAPLRRRAGELAASIDAQLWMDAESTYAVGLDGDKRQIDSVASNPGHLLWAGAVSPDRAAAVADRMMCDDVFTGFGIRTLSSANPGYNPLSYHCGSVWPHDTSLLAAGLYRYGLTDAAQRLTNALLDAAAAFDGRLPELYGGFSRDDFATPVPYPTASAPQAWAAAAPALLVQAMLGLDPDVPHGRVRLDPRLPPGFDLKLRRVRLGTSTLGVRATAGTVDVFDAPSGLDVVVNGS
jgi:glycogen debranching enzyme